MEKLRKIRWRLPLADAAWLHFKWALAAMLVVPMLQSPTLQQNTTWVFLAVWLAICAAGTLVATAGLFLGAQAGDVRRRGLRLEFTGLILMMTGPVVFMLVQVGLWVEHPETNRLLAVAFPYVIIAAVLARLAIIKTAARRGTVIVRYMDETGAADTDSIPDAR